MAFPSSDEEPEMKKGMSTNDKLNAYSTEALRNLDLQWAEVEDAPSVYRIEYPFTLEGSTKKDKSHYHFYLTPGEYSFYSGVEWGFDINCNIKGNADEVFPFKSPRVKFIGTVFHPNIDLNGNVCLRTIGNGWKANTKLNDLHNGLIAFFDNPNSDDPLNHQAANLLVKSREEYAAKVKETLKGGEFYGKTFKKLI